MTAVSYVIWGMSIGLFGCGLHGSQNIRTVGGDPGGLKGAGDSRNLIITKLEQWRLKGVLEIVLLLV